jgi:hypothetical protein
MSEQSYQPVRQLKIEGATVNLQILKSPPWQNFKPLLKVDGHGEIQHHPEQSTLSIQSGQWTIHMAERASLEVIATDATLSGIQPNGRLQCEKSNLQLSPRPQLEPSAVKGIFNDLGSILALTALLSLLFSPLFLPPQHLSYLVLASASLYLGLNGSKKRVLITSLSVGAITLILPLVSSWIEQKSLILEGSLSYGLKIGLYLILWGGGKKIKDWYRGNIL